MSDLLNVTTDDGKYTLIQTADGRMGALRHGEPWDAGRDAAIGDKRLLTFAQDLASTRAAHVAAVAENHRLFDIIDRHIRRLQDYHKGSTQPNVGEAWALELKAELEGQSK